YCHPYLMPKFWQFPTGSMGLGPINAIYQARFMRYLEHRGLLETQGRKVWTFVGDGEMDEPESLAGLSLATREGLDNLIFVFNREHFFNKYPELRELISNMSDSDIDRLKRGGHDPVKIYAAYHAAANHKGQPTVILAQTKKGYGMGTGGQGKMGTHQQKKLDDDALREFRDRFSLPLSDEDVAQVRFYQPGADSPEIKYLEARRQALGGYLPARE